MQLQRAVEAEAPADESLALYRQIHGDAHASTALARGHLAQLLHARGQLDGAIALYREALPLLDRTLDDEAQTERAAALIEAAAAVDERLYVSDIVLCEVVRVGMHEL